jgi:hypothetical protein
MTSHNGSILMVMAMGTTKVEPIQMLVSMTLPLELAQPLTALVALTAMVTDIRMLTQTGLHIRSDLLMHSQSLHLNGTIRMATDLAMKLLGTTQMLV